MIVGDDLSDYSYPLHMLGTATPLGPEDEDDTIRRLHEAVEEVTGRPVERREKPRIGFL